MNLRPRKILILLSSSERQNLIRHAKSSAAMANDLYLLDCAAAKNAWDRSVEYAPAHPAIRAAVEQLFKTDPQFFCHN